VEAPPTDPEQRREASATFLRNAVQEIEPLQRQHNEAVWEANITGDPAHEAESARLDAEIRRILARREPFEYLSAILAQGEVGDAQIQRQLVLLHHSFQAQQIPPEMIERMVKAEKSLESRFNRFRAELGGERVTDNELNDILRQSDDSLRRRRA